MKKVTLLTIGCLAVLNVHAAVMPKSLATDSHIKVVSYDPNNVVVIKSKFGYETVIVLGANETIKTIAMGDSNAWNHDYSGNKVYISPMAPSKTNMTVDTGINTYNFFLDSTDPNVSPTFKVQFNYPDGGFSQSGQRNAVASFEPDKLNWKYSFTGDRSLAPIEAFDNGEFTYLKFGQHQSIPAIFVVDKNQHETLINYQMQGDYVVINSIDNQFTLRNGKIVTSVYNDAAIGDWRAVA